MVTHTFHWLKQDTPSLGLIRVDFLSITALYGVPTSATQGRDILSRVFIYRPVKLLLDTWQRKVLVATSCVIDPLGLLVLTKPIQSTLELSVPLLILELL